jgi:flagellar assembly protein FliH
LSPEAAVTSVRFPSFAVAREAPEPVAPPRPIVEDRRSARAAAHAEGLARGRAEGHAAAFAEWSPRLAALAAALEAAGHALRQRREALAEELGAHLAEVVLTLTRKVLDRELAMGDAAVRATAEQLARRLTAGGAIGVRVTPAVAEVLAAWRGAGGPLGEVVVRADASLNGADFIVETDAGFLDGRVATQLAEAARILEEYAS